MHVFTKISQHNYSVSPSEPYCTCSKGYYLVLQLRYYVIRAFNTLELSLLRKLGLILVSAEKPLTISRIKPIAASFVRLGNVSNN